MWKKAQKLLACLLAVLLLSSATALSPAVFAVDETSAAPVLQSAQRSFPQMQVKSRSSSSCLMRSSPTKPVWAKILMHRPSTGSTIAREKAV